MSREEEHIDPALVRSKLRVFEDHNLALRLQEEEFNRHYNQNRTERRVVGSDTKTSKTEQQREDEFARSVRLSASRRIAETDEEVARRIAAEWEAEETRKVLEKEDQLRRDAELAKALEREVSPSTSTPHVHFSTYNDQSSYAPNTVPTSRIHDLPVQPASVDDLLSMPSLQISDNSSYSNPILQGTVVDSVRPVSSPTGTRGIALPGLSTPNAQFPDRSLYANPVHRDTAKADSNSFAGSPTRPRGIPLPGLARPEENPAPIDIGSPTLWPAPPPAAASNLSQPAGSTFGNTFGTSIHDQNVSSAGFSQPSDVPPTGSTVGRNAFRANEPLNINPVPQVVSTNPFDPSFWNSSNTTFNQNQSIQHNQNQTMPPLPAQQSAVPQLVPMPSLPNSVLPSASTYNNQNTNNIDSPPPAYDEFGLPLPSALALGQSGVQHGYSYR